MSQNTQDRRWSVYKHTSPSGKCYIGITSKNPKDRWGKNGIHYKKQPFYYAIEKYGWDNIAHEVLYSGLSEEEAKAKEKELIKKYKSKESEHGYNCTYGGDGSLGYKRSKESIEKTILGNSKVVYQYSVDGTFIRKWDSIKAVEKELGYPNNGISTCCNGKARQAYGYIWRHEYTDAVEPIKLGQGITVYQYSLNGNFIKEWDSLAEIENTLGFAATNISVCCKGGQSTSYGYIWSFDKYDKVTPIQEIYYHQYDLDGNYIQSFKTEKEASKKLGYKSLSIIEVCKGERKQAGGYMWSYEKKDKIKPYQKHKTNNRKIFQYELDGTFVAEWDSITSAIKSIGVSTVGGISGCLSGRYKTSHRYLWSDKRINF